MNKFVLSFVLIVSGLRTLSQSSTTTHPSLLEVRFLLTDYKAGSPFNSDGKMDAGLGFGYTHGWKTHFDWTIGINSSFPDSASELHPSAKKYMLIEGDVCMRARINQPKKIWQPYLQAGFGISGYHGDVGIFVPVGVGLQRRISSALYLLANAQYRLALSSQSNDHYFYTLGIAGTIAKGKKVIKANIPNSVSSTNISTVVRDRDGDGIVDSADACPDQAGLAKFAGCPDTDKDGVPDNRDKCPTIPGLLKYEGCPAPDRDGDGIVDDDDSCPSIAGFAKYHGCPIPDSDNDGINDEEDSCINTPGLKEFHGCPGVKEEVIRAVDLAAKNIFFETASFKLLPASYPALDKVAKILKDNPRFNLKVDGHTDNVGSRESNQLLSMNRARSIVTYLIKKGIDASRLSANGYGEDLPVADNNTSQGRAANRRVELKLQE